MTNDLRNLIGEDDTIFNIETVDGERYVHFYGYGYYTDGGEENGKDYRFVEYTFCYATLDEVLTKGLGAVEDECAPAVTQYITDCTEEEMMDIYLHYDNGNCPTPITEITADMADGCYILV